MPVSMKTDAPALLAVGAHQKNTVAVAIGREIFASQHIGDLATLEAREAFERTTASLCELYAFEPEAVVCDQHPDYASTRHAESLGLPVYRVQHHHAHILACMAENELSGPVLGVGWDGTGYGTDGTVWGGEFLRVEERSYRRFARLRTFRLPGGEEAVREPVRAAIGVLHELFGAEIREALLPKQIRGYLDGEGRMLIPVLQAGLNTPVTSSAGRLFDAVAALCGLRMRVAFEGQAAMELEWALAGGDSQAAYPVRFLEGETPDGPATIDWAPMVHGVLSDLGENVSAGEISARFHNTLAEFVIEGAKRARESQVVLSGGCFQNKYLTERCMARLHQEGFRVYCHQRIPPNDGGIAVGQIVGASSTPRSQSS